MSARKKPPSARAARRAAERDANKLVRARERLAALEPGGAPDRPIGISSASLVEVEARAARCVQCGGSLRVLEHTVEQHEQGRLRVAHVVCTTCGAPRRLHFRLAEPS